MKSIPRIVFVLSLGVLATSMASAAEPIQPVRPVQDVNLAQVELGKKLYFDPRLSRSGFISCNSCHNLSVGGTDNLKTSIGHNWQQGPINAPTVLNSSLAIAQFWDGRAADLKEQAAGPIANPGEMAFSHSLAVDVLSSIPAYVKEFKLVFGADEINQNMLMRQCHAQVPAVADDVSPFVRSVARRHPGASLVIAGEGASFGYPPSRVWGTPTTAMWVYRLGIERAKRMLFTGDLVTGVEAADMGLVLQAVPAAELDSSVQALCDRIKGVPRNQLMMSKMAVNQAYEAMGLANTKRFANFFDGIARHSPEGLWFRERAQEVGFHGIQISQRFHIVRLAHAEAYQRHLERTEFATVPLLD